MRQRCLYVAPSVARCPPALLGPARGPARPAPARARGLDAGGVVGAPARAAPRGAAPVGALRARRVAPGRAAPARAPVVDLARGRADQRVRGEALVGHRDVARLDALEGAVGVEPGE